MLDVKKVIIDTDPGDDDATSILWVLANSDIIDVLAITVVNGNVDVDKCAVNALHVTEIAGRSDIPVFKGAYKPLCRKGIKATWIHGDDGLGDLGLPLPSKKVSPGFAPVEMIRMVKTSPEPVTILALGPLTNIALAILLDKDFKNNVKEIIFMGGAVRVSGNQSPKASFNPAVDPEAAKIVYSSGIPVVQIGLDVCDLVTQRVEDLDEIAKNKTAITDFIISILAFRREKAVKLVKDNEGRVIKKIKASEQVPTRGQGIGLNDLTATAYLIEPDWFKTIDVYADIAVGGLCDGETVIDYKGLCGKTPNIKFAYYVKGEDLVRRWAMDMSV